MRATTRWRVRHRSAVGVLLALLAVVALGGCGIEPDGAARADEDAEVPFDLLNREPTPVTSAPGTPTDRREVCLIGAEGQLVDTEREVPLGTDLLELLQLLAEPTTAAERGFGLTTALPEAEDMLDVELVGGVALVALSPRLIETSGGVQVEAIGQMVCTLTRQAGVGQVQFRVDGEALEVPRGDGTTSSSPVAGRDYAELGGP